MLADLTPHEIKVEALRSAIERLPERDRGFAADLCKGYDTRGSLSEKQFFWVETLLKKLPSKEGEPAPAGEFKAIVDLFDKAAEQLKKPVIHFGFKGSKGRLSRAPDTGNNKGAVYIKIAGTYEGKITQDGRAQLISKDERAANHHCAAARLTKERRRFHRAI